MEEKGIFNEIVPAFKEPAKQVRISIIDYIVLTKKPKYF